jgi:hypothetical protein
LVLIVAIGALALLLVVCIACLPAITSMFVKLGGLFEPILGEMFAFCYRIYRSLSDSCQREYEQMRVQAQSTGKRFVLALSCLFFCIQKVFHQLVLPVATKSIFIGIGLSILFPIITTAKMNQFITERFGIPLFEYLGLFPMNEVVYAIILYLAFHSAVIGFILIVAKAWHEWGKEMQGSSMVEIEALLNQIEDPAFVNQFMDRIEDQSFTIRSEADRYLDILQNHIEEYADFRDLLEKQVWSCDHLLTRTNAANYFKLFLQILTIRHNARIHQSDKLYRKFKKLLPRLQKRKEDLLKQIQARQQYESETDHSQSQDAHHSGEQHTTREQERYESVHFVGCETIEQLEKRYRSLSKAYHPDMNAGNEEAFVAMRKEYERVKAKMMENKEN